MKKATVLVICGLMVFSPMAVMLSVSVGAGDVRISPLFPGGSGTPGDPYWIVNVSDLQNMNTDL